MSREKQDGCFGDKNKAIKEGHLQLNVEKKKIPINLICKMHCRIVSLQSPYLSYLTRKNFALWHSLTSAFILLFLSQLLTSAFQKEIYTMSWTSYKHRLIKNKLALDVGKSQTHMFREFFHSIIINFLQNE